MIVNLIKTKQIFSLTLPRKVKGQYYLTDIDEKGSTRQLIGIEAVDGSWLLKSNKIASIVSSDGSVVPFHPLNNASFITLKIAGSDEQVKLFTEPVDHTRHSLSKILVNEPTVLKIGRADDNNLIFNYHFVSSHHAELLFDGEGWSISDCNSKNGTYVNGFRVEKRRLNPGDYIYIMGLKIIIGDNFFAVNNPDEMLKIKSSALSIYKTPVSIDDTDDIDAASDTDYFLRSPRFHREATHSQITIDPPPQPQKIDSVPLALMLGPSITMGMTSVSTGIISVSNAISSGGDIMQAMPTLMMSASMLLGTILWPILTKKYEKKQKIKNEQLRQEKYLAYLNDISDRIKKEVKEQTEILKENIVSNDNCIARITNKSSNLWERVIGQSDFLCLRLGIGKLPLDVEIKYQEKKFSMEDDTLQNAMLALAEEPKTLDSVPISISLVENRAIGVFGNKIATGNFLKSLILQITTLHSYDEVKIVLFVDEMDSSRWDFAKYIPHFWSDDKAIRFYATNLDEMKDVSSYIEKNLLARNEDTRREYNEYKPYYVIISTSDMLRKKCPLFNQLLKIKNNIGFTIINSSEIFSNFPKETKTIIEVNEKESKIFDKDDTSGKQVVFAVEKINEELLNNVSEQLSSIELDIADRSYTMPSMITFLEMFNVGKVEHLNSLTRWKENNPTKTLQTPVGMDEDGDTFNLDLHEKFHGPHGLIAGMTGSGKSEFIITYILSLAVNYHPNEVSFILIDYKGGGLAGAFEDKERGIKLPHLAGTITNLDGAAIKRSLISIQSELRRRQAVFNKARKLSGEGTMDIYKYQQLFRDKIVSEPLPHLFIISDEFAELKSQQPEFMEQLISTARIGRSLGIHLILATQKPSGVVDDQIWSNSKFRVCLKVQDKSDSQDMIKCSDAAELTQTGRFYLQVGYNELFALGQSAWCGADYIPSDEVIKDKDNGIKVIDNIGRTVLNVRPAPNINLSSGIKQNVAIIKYLSDLADEEAVSAIPLWLEPIPENIYLSDVEAKYNCQSTGYILNPVVGEYDDPFNQRQSVLTIPFSNEGNCVVYGATGNGKTTFLTTLCYSLIKNHTADEVNLYILDFGSETLKAFENAPHIGGVITSSDEDKTYNLFKLLLKEMEYRRNLFSTSGGDFNSYCMGSNDKVPNIIVVLNNFSGFSEQYEDLLDVFTLLSRDGIKFGIYFAVTASNTSAIRYKIQQNFKIALTMQLNDPTDYAMIVGKTDGLIPSKCKGRGLVALDRPYEFQTAYCAKTEDMVGYIKAYCQNLADNAFSVAKQIPVLPKRVDLEFVRKNLGNLKSVPIGVSKASLNIISLNVSGRVAIPVVAREIEDMTAFADEFSHVLKKVATTQIIDADQLLSIENLDCDSVVASLFADMVARNNTYKDAGLDEAVLAKFDEKIFVIIGLKKFFDKLSDDSKDKMKTLLDKGEAIYKLHFILCDSIANFNTFNYDDWFKRHVANGDGIWVGDGVADQYLLKINKITSDLYDELEPSYGYFVSRGKSTLVKLLEAEGDGQG